VRPGTAEEHVVDDVAAAFADLVRRLDPPSIALSGGETARRCYAALARHPPKGWAAVEVYFGDERWVPATDPASNEGLARAALLDQVPPRRVHSLRAAGVTPATAATAYDALLRTRPPLALVHLGLGADGHTASLFPGSPALDEREAFVVVAHDEAHAWERLTFTLPAIARAATVVFTVAGPDKRDALTRVRAHDSRCPAARVVAARVIWLVGRDAA
jgi:6-phosphogluconolactonase